MKKIFLSLIIWFIWLISFWNCQNTWDTKSIKSESTRAMSIDLSDWMNQTYTNSQQLTFNNPYCHTDWYYLMVCIVSDSNRNLKFWQWSAWLDVYWNWTPYCFVLEWYTSCDFVVWTNNWPFDFTVSANRIYTSVYDSATCQSEYSLMPIDSCNSEYCELNWLCEVIWWSWSSTLYINDVRHESAPFIYVNIPEEFKRDYLTWEQEFTINVEWLNGDQDYINWIIDVNSYRPTSEDFTQTFVWWLTLIFPYIIITAVILFIWRFIRKIFK